MSEDYKKPFIPIWMDKAKLTPHEFRVLAHLWSRGQDTCFPSLETIAKCCGIKRGTVCKVLNSLEEKGFVTRKKRKAKGIRYSNIYILTGPSRAPVKAKPTTDKQGRLGHHVTGPFGAPGNRAVWGTGNDTSMNDSSLNDTSKTKETTFSGKKEDCFSNSEKQELLLHVSQAKTIDYPTENEFDEFLEHAALDLVINGRPEIYHELTEHKWNNWNTKRGRWEHIKDWRKYLEALNAKMDQACGR